MGESRNRLRKLVLSAEELNEKKKEKAELRILETKTFHICIWC